MQYLRRAVRRVLLRATLPCMGGADKTGADAAMRGGLAEDFVLYALQPTQRASCALRALLAQLPVPGDAAHVITSDGAACVTLCAGEEDKGDVSPCEPTCDEATHDVTVGALYDAALRSSPASPPIGFDDFVECVLELAPVLVHTTPSTQLVARLLRQHRQDDTPRVSSPRLPATETTQLLRHVLVRWQPWVSAEAWARIRRRATGAEQRLARDALAEYLCSMHELHARVAPMQTSTSCYVRWLLQHVPPYYVPLSLVHAATTTAPCAVAEPAFSWPELLHDAQRDKLLLTWSPDGSLLRLRRPPRAICVPAVSTPTQDEEGVVHGWQTHSPLYTAPQRYALLPRDQDLFHAALQLLAHVVPTYFVSLDALRPVHAALVSSPTKGPSASVQAHFPVPECLIGHPDVAFALEWRAVREVRLHPGFAHRDRGIADAAYGAQSKAVVVATTTTTHGAADETLQEYLDALQVNPDPTASTPPTAAPADSPADTVVLESEELLRVLERDAAALRRDSCDDSPAPRQTPAARLFDIPTTGKPDRLRTSRCGGVGARGAVHPSPCRPGKDDHRPRAVAGPPPQPPHNIPPAPHTPWTREPWSSPGTRASSATRDGHSTSPAREAPRQPFHP